MFFIVNSLIYAAAGILFAPVGLGMALDIWRRSTREVHVVANLFLKLLAVGTVLATITVIMYVGKFVTY